MSAGGTHDSNVGSPGWWAIGDGWDFRPKPPQRLGLRGYAGHAVSTSVDDAYSRAVIDALTNLNADTGSMNGLIVHISFGLVTTNFHCFVVVVQSAKTANTPNPAVALP